MNKKPLKSEVKDKTLNRRDLVRKGAKVAYVAPLVLAAVKATERPAYGQSSLPPKAPIPG